MFSRELKPLERSKKKQSNALGKGRQHKVSKVFYSSKFLLAFGFYKKQSFLCSMMNLEQDKMV